MQVLLSSQNFIYQIATTLALASVSWSDVRLTCDNEVADLIPSGVGNILL